MPRRPDSMHRRLIDRISLELSADVALKVRTLSARTGQPLRKVIETAIVEHLRRVADEHPDLNPEVENHGA